MLHNRYEQQQKWYEIFAKLYVKKQLSFFLASLKQIDCFRQGQRIED